MFALYGHGSDSTRPLIPKEPVSDTDLGNGGCLRADKEPRCEEEAWRIRHNRDARREDLYLSRYTSLAPSVCSGVAF